MGQPPPFRFLNAGGGTRTPDTRIMIPSTPDRQRWLQGALVHPMISNDAEFVKFVQTTPKARPMTGDGQRRWGLSP